MEELNAAAKKLVECVASKANVGQPSKIVLAESCTGGMAAAGMTTVPGVSAYLCGSAVTYREKTKQAWLGINEADLKEHTAESAFASREMAIRVLELTPEAGFSAAITGHLGPGVDNELDGIVYIGITIRGEEECREFRALLQGASRVERQIEAATLLLNRLHEVIESFQATND